MARNRELRRRGPRRETPPRFFLVCEGRNTEPGYFKALGLIFPRVRIEIEAGAGDPFAIAEKCARRSREAERRDRVWAVFDRDTHERFQEALDVCREDGAGVARSNPCFEVWLILHDAEEYDAPRDSRAVQADLARLRPDYDRGGAKTLDFGDLVERVEEAEARAETGLRRREDEGDPYGNPSTTVGRLTREIRKAHKEASRR